MKKFIFVCMLIASFIFITHKDLIAKPSTDPGLTYNEPCSGIYPKEPPFLSQSAKSSTTLLVDFSGSLNEHAYQENEVKWDTNSTNATAYSGYDSSSTYYGYFDSDLFYTYDSSQDLFENSTTYTNSSWRGNFLNWASMHRIDILKKALTGGTAFYDSTSETYKYTVSSTDGLLDRGKYHILDPSNFNSTNEIPTDLQNTVLGFEQRTGDATLTVYLMNKTSSDPDPATYKPFGDPVNTFQLTMTGKKPLGTLHKIGPSTRLALFTFNDDDPAQGGKALIYMADNSTEVINFINEINVMNSNSWSNVSESLHTVIGYIQNATSISENGPRYNTTNYEISKTRDPYYFPDKGINVPCTQQNIIIISDGIPNQDKNIPGTLGAFDQSNNDNPSLDGTYIDNLAYWAHTTDLRPDLEGIQKVNIYSIALYSPNSSFLKDAAKWGGFTDFNADGTITENELTDKFGKPYTFFDILSASNTGDNIEAALSISAGSTSSKASSGGSASIVTTSSDGEGLLYHPIFWPQLTDSKDNSITWAGDVKTFWLGNSGVLYADDGNNSFQLDGSDTPITIWYDESDLDNKRTRICPSANFTNGQCSGGAKELNEVQPVWSAAKQLYSLSNATIHDQADYGTRGKRYIFTWTDHDREGDVDASERTAAYANFDTDNTSLLKFLDAETINWIRGLDQPGLRSRSSYVDSESDTVTWRLGDVINSSPTIVGTPAENYHIYWKDNSYKDFLNKYRNRRIMAYFGANDGMLHAVSSGFYNKSDKSYYRTNDFDPNPLDTVPELGDEMWAYVPYNLFPHLECLTKLGYQHQYYVDLKPRVFDVKAFAPSEKHPSGWGTILVGGFNFGGDGTQSLKMIRDDSYVDDRAFGSSYFILDITNPEEPPTLLGEMTFDGTVKLGFSISPPTVVATTDGTTGDYGVNTVWHLLFGNGPEDTNGFSSQSPYGLVIPLKELIQTSSFKLRLTQSKNKLPPTETQMGFIDFGQSLGGGSNFKACISTGFVSIDYDRNNFVDMMYYGLITTDGDNRGGGMHRLRVENRDPSKWSVKEMTTTDQPVTGAPNAALKDAEGKTGSIWVTFGTGIFWENDHKENTATNWLYGIEEPKKAGSYNFSPIDTKFLHDVTWIGVNGTDGLGTLVCEPGADYCNIPDNVITVEDLGDHIQTTANIDGWKRKLLTSGERVLGQPTLFGGLTNFTTYTPANDLCSSDGNSKLYALYYRTGTPWKENVFGDAAEDYVPYVVNLGRGVSITPSLHLGSEKGVKAYVQTSTGSIIEIHQPNLPITGVKSGMGGWHTLGID